MLGITTKKTASTNAINEIAEGLNMSQLTIYLGITVHNMA